MSTNSNITLNRVFSIFFILLLLTSNSYAQSSSADTQVELGIMALKKGQFKKALHFLTSPIANVSSHPNKQNALGLSYYYLHQYNNAKKHFKLAQKTPRLYEAAFYLGEIALKQDNRKQAKYWYSLASKQFKDHEVQAQAENALLNLSLKRKPTQTNNYKSAGNYLYLSLDSNLIDGITDPDETSGSSDSDTSTAFLMAGKISLLSSKKLLDWNIGGVYFAENYDDFKANNTDLFQLFTSLGFVSENQYLEFKVSKKNQTLDGHDYLEETGLDIKNIFYYEDNYKFILSAAVIDVLSPDGNYSQYNGATSELGAKIKGGDRINWLLGVKWREEGRQGLSNEKMNNSGETFTEFTAYDRNILKFKAKVSWHWDKQWQQQLIAKYRTTQYQEADQYLALDSDVELSSFTRESTRLTVKAKLIHSLTQKLELSFQYEFMDEDSNVDSGDYQSQTFSTGLSYIF